MRTETEVRDAMNRLNRLVGRPTRYEVVVEVVGGPSWIAGYAPAPGKWRLHDMATPVPAEVVARAGVTERSAFGYDRERGWWFLGDKAELRIRRGRTERAALLEGELPPLPRPRINN